MELWLEVTRLQLKPQNRAKAVVASALDPRNLTNAGSAAEWVTGPTSAEKPEETEEGKEEIDSQDVDAADHPSITGEVDHQATVVEVAMIAEVAEDQQTEELENAVLETAGADHLQTEEETWQAAQ